MVVGSDPPLDKEVYRKDATSAMNTKNRSI